RQIGTQRTFCSGPSAGFHLFKSEGFVMWRCRWTAWVGLCLFFAWSSQALGQTLSFLDESGAPTSVYAERTRVYLQVADPVANVSPGKGTVQGRLAPALGGDGELVTLTETGTSSGIFRGDVALAQKGG